jgi:murein tripeptide amidase MpaA
MRTTTTPGLAVLIGLVIGLVFSAGPAAGQPGEVVSVAERDFAAARLGRRGLDLLMRRAGRVYLVASPGELAALSALRVDWTVETARLQKASQEALSAAGGINGAYHSTLELETDLRILERDHPGLATVVEIGRSLEDRGLLALKISDNAAASESEPGLLVLGCHHAREWISVEVPYLFGKYLLDNYDRDPQVRALVDASEIWIVPIVNPDGLEYSIHVYRYWRKNRRANADGTFGVDVNRNYGLAWGYDNNGSSGYPGSEVYRGPSAFSEPETAAVRALFTGASSDFRALVSFHSYGQDILYPWGYTTAPAPDAASLGVLAGTMAGLIAAVQGTVYTYGQGSTALYLTNGDTADWAYSLRGAPAFTLELPPVDVDHGGFFNDEAAIGAIFQESLPALLYLARYAVDHPLPDRPPIRPDGRWERTVRSAPAKSKPTSRPAPGPIR